MFVSQAHSFRQQARLAVTLAWIAGYTNIIAVLACGTVVSHVTGTASNLGRDIAETQWPLAAFTLFLLATFFGGAAVSGLFTELGRRRAWESIYVLPMLAEAVLLGLFALGLEVDLHIRGPATLYLMAGLASMAMGLQNATITRISSGVIRTTHVTGVLTDLALETVQMLWWVRDRYRNIPPAPARGLIHSAFTHPTLRRLALLGSIIFTFALGAGLGTFAYEHVARWAMFPPVAFLLWIVYQDVARPIAEIQPSDQIAATDLPSGLAVFHLRKDRDRRGKVHRMPNLLAWSDRLPASIRVVILDLAEVTELDANAAMELHAVLARLADRGRQLIVSGLTAERFDRIQSLGTDDSGKLPPEFLDLGNVCPDLDLAVARGINLLTPDS